MKKIAIAQIALLVATISIAVVRGWSWLNACTVGILGLSAILNLIFGGRDEG